MQLTRVNGHLVFENPQVRLTLTPLFEVQEMALKEAFDGALSLREAVEMAVIFQGIDRSLPFLLLK